MWNYKPYCSQKLLLLKYFQSQQSGILETSCLVYLTSENLANNFNVTFYLVFYTSLPGDVWGRENVLIILWKRQKFKSVHSQREFCHITKLVASEGERKVIYYSQLAPKSYGDGWVICPPWPISVIFVDYLFPSGIIGCQSFVKRIAAQNSVGGCVLLLATYTIKKRERCIYILSGLTSHFFWSLVKRRKENSNITMNEDLRTFQNRSSKIRGSKVDNAGATERPLSL